MWPFDRKLESIFNKTISVRVHGVKFKIKKIDMTSFLDGSKVMLQAYDIYKVEKSNSQVKQQSFEKIKEHYRDVFLASVVEPKLSRKPSQNEEIYVDHLFTEWDLANKLYESIIEYTYGKKKLKLNNSQEAT
jgi:hypothetical protein